MSVPVQTETEHAETVSSLLAESLTPRAPDAQVRARLLEAVRGPERFTPWAREIASAFRLAVEDTLSALRLMADSHAWRPGPWPDSQLLVTPALIERRAVIARLPAGVRIPAHRHQARELTYVLDGELVENQRVRYGRGMLLEMLPDSEHDVAVPPGEPCLVVFTSSAD